MPQPNHPPCTNKKNRSSCQKKKKKIQHAAAKIPHTTTKIPHITTKNTPYGTMKILPATIKDSRGLDKDPKCYK
jgi:hypothetical protein